MVDMALAAELSDLIDLITPFAIQAANELRLADALAGGPRTVEQLADALDCRADALRRLLRTLSRKDIFAEPEPDVFALGRLGELLRSDHPISLREANLPWLPNVLSLADLAHSVRTGLPSFDHVHGTDLWHYLATHPDDAELFDRQMRSISGFEAASLVASYPWGTVRSVADIGGGDGTLLTALLAAYGTLTGTLFDQPQVLPTVDGPFALVAGDFFVDDLPPEHDLYVLKRIVYGFSDQQANALLANLRRATRPGARVLLVEPLLRGGAADPYFTHRIDLMMMAVPGGRVRTVQELTALLDDAGFAVSRVIDSATPAIEAVAR